MTNNVSMSLLAQAVEGPDLSKQELSRTAQNGMVRCSSIEAEMVAVETQFMEVGWQFPEVEIYIVYVGLGSQPILWMACCRYSNWAEYACKKGQAEKVVWCFRSTWAFQG